MKKVLFLVLVAATSTSYAQITSSASSTTVGSEIEFSYGKCIICPPLTWSCTGATKVASTPNSITYTFSKAGTYTVRLTVRNSNGTTSSYSKSIKVCNTVVSQPIVSNTSRCGKGSVRFTPSGSTGNYKWYYSWGGIITTDVNNGIYVGNNGSYLQINNLTFTNKYRVTALDDCGNESSRKTVTATMNPIPSVGITQSTSICPGSTVTLHASGADSYSWSNGSQSSSITVNPRVNTTYTVTGTKNGCSNSISTTVSMRPLPPVSISGANQVCPGGSVNLTASGASTYSWSYHSTLNKTSGSTVIARPTSNTTYTVTGIDNNGCSKSVSFTVYLKSVPNISITTNKTRICKGEGITLTASGGSSYQWSSNVGSENLNKSLITVYPNSNTTYSLVGYNNGCANSTSILIQVDNPPNLIVPPTQTICYGQEVKLKLNGADDYSISPNTGIIDDAGFCFVVAPEETTEYSIIGTSNGCTQTKTVNVIVIPQSDTPQVKDVATCGQTAMVVIQGEVENGITEDYHWYESQDAETPFQTIGNFVELSENGEVWVEKVGACPSPRVRALVTFYDPPSPPQIEDVTNCGPGDVSLKVVNPQGSYKWFDESGIEVETNLEGYQLSGFGNHILTVNGVTSDRSFSVKEVTEYCGESESSSANIIIFSIPELSVGGAISVCNGSSDINLDTFSQPPGGVWTGVNVSNNIFTPNQPGNFSLTYQFTSPDGCLAQATKNINVIEDTNPGYVRISGFDPNNCNQQNISLSLEEASEGEVKWYYSEPGSGYFLEIPFEELEPLNERNVSWTINSDKIVKAVVSGSCGDEETQPVTISMPDPPEIPIVQTQDICSPGEITFNISNYDENLQYTWKFEDQNVEELGFQSDRFDLVTVSQDQLVITTSEIGIYSFDISAVRGNCISTAEAVGKVIDSNIELYSFDELVFCSGSSVKLRVSSSEQFEYQYYFNNSPIGGITQQPFIEARQEGVYKVEAIGQGCEFTSNEVFVEVEQRPEAPTNPVPGYRFGPGELTLSVNGSVSSYKWINGPDEEVNNGSLTKFHQTNTSYSVFAISDFGCLSEESTAVSVTIYDLPEIVSDGELSLSPGDSLELKTKKGYYDSYKWLKSQNVVSTEGSVWIKSPGVYTLEVSKQTASTSLEVEIKNTLFNQNKNFIVSQTITKAGVKSLQEVEELSIQERDVQVSYFDGLGRQIQGVDVKSSPKFNDLVTQLEYDLSGRQTKEWLPYADAENTGRYKSNSQSQAYSFYNNHGTSIPVDAEPYSVSIYESSSLNRVVDKGAPGATWQPGRGHSIRTSYRTNYENEVKKWQMDKNGYPTNDPIIDEIMETDDLSGLKFDGVDDYIAIDKSFSNPDALSRFSVSAWVKTDFKGGGSHDNWAIFDFDRSEYFNLFIYGNTGKVGFATRGSTIHDFASNSSVNDGKWHHIVAVYDGADKMIYVDGELDAKSVDAHNGQYLGTGSTRYGIIGDGSEAKTFNGKRNNKYFDGTIHSIDFWQNVLGERDIVELLNGQTINKSGHLLSYKFDAIQGESLFNLRDQGGHGILYNFNPQQEQVISATEMGYMPSNELIFDGVDDYVALDFNYNPSDRIPELTLEAWVKTNETSSDRFGNWSIIDFDRSEFYNLYVAGDGRVGFSTYGGQINDFFSNSRVNDDQWHHIAAVFDGNEKKIYIDGVQDNSILNPHSSSQLGKSTTRFGFIGDGSEASKFNAGRNNKFFKGNISEVRIWHSVRSAEQINSNMMYRINPDQEGLMAYYTFSQNQDTQLHDYSGNGRNGTLFNMDIQESWEREGPELSSYYSPGSLYVTEVMDENGNTTIEYKDLQDRVILKKSQIGNEWAETIYIYNHLSQLVMVIQPEGAKRFNSEYSFDPDRFLDNWAFRYKYDERGRVVEKKVPGKGWEYMVYDQRDRLLMTQDANMRTENKWLVTKYDHLDREVFTGLKVINMGRSNLQNTINEEYGDLESFQRLIFGGGIHGYKDDSYPELEKEEILTVKYYDNYEYDGLIDPGSLSFIEALLPDYSYINQVNGQLTGEKTKILQADRWIKSEYYYNQYYRLIQEAKEDHLESPLWKLYVYDFVGNKTLESEIRFGNQEVVPIGVLQNLEYDHSLRLQRIKHTLGIANYSKEVDLLKFDYNEIGVLERKSLHLENNTPLQSLDYKNNIRGWLTHINDAELSDQSDWFGMELHYNHTLNNNQPNFNGNISSITWSKRGPGQISRPRLYNYQYDELNRIQAGHYFRKYQGHWAAEQGLFDASEFHYDLNGNLEKLKRNGMFDQKTEFDHLVYQYNDGNQLTSVSDLSGHPSGFDDGYGGDDYQYDANGNLIQDLNKGISAISYNYLNLPETVQLNEGSKIDFVYDAVGNKLSQETTQDGKTSKRYYEGSFVFNDQGIEEIQHSEGRIIPRRDNSGTITDYEYQYHMKDHLGNVRLTFSEDEFTDISVFTATMEIKNSEAEADFSHIEDTRHTFVTANHTEGGNKAARLNAFEGRIIGPGISFSVLPGDMLSAEVYAYYEQSTGGNASVVGDALLASSLAGAFGFNGGIETQFINDFFSEASSGLGAIGGNNSDIPNAYLNYLLFDENYVLIDFGHLQVSENAKNNPDLEYLSIQDIEVSKEGYAYLYVSNESNIDLNVWFDDLKITHISKSHIVQMDDYYPFGLGIDALSYRRGGVENRYLYNGGSENSDILSGIHLTPNRLFDSSVGRMIGIDAMSDLMPSISPMVYGFNNPIIFNDPLGLFPKGGDDKKPKKKKDRGVAWTTTLPELNFTGSKINHVDHTYEYLYRSINPIERGVGIAIRRGESKWLANAFNRSNRSISWKGYRGETQFGKRFYKTFGEVLTYGIGGTMLTIYGVPLAIQNIAKTAPLILSGKEAIVQGVTNGYWKLGGAYNYSNLIATNGARTFAYNAAYWGRPVLLGSTGKLGVKTFVELIHFSNYGNIDLFKTGKALYDIYSGSKKILDEVKK